MSAPWLPVPSGVLGPDQIPVHVNVRLDVFVAKLLKYDTAQMMAIHAGMGVAEEAGELLGCIKKHQIYNKPLDSIMKEDGKPLETHILEEAGDVIFYVQAVLNQYGFTFEECLAHLGAKLATRYQGLEYSDEAANARKDKS